MPLFLPHEIEAFTPADAVEVDQNYARITEWINTQMIFRDGSQTMTGDLTLFKNPTQPMHAVPKQYIDALIPIGSIFPYGGMTAPAGGDWLPCNGAEVQISAYTKLHDVLQGRYGTATAGTFKLPNLRGRVMIGMNIADDNFEESGKSGGTWTVPIPQHHHAMTHDHPAATTGVEPDNHQHPIGHNHGNFSSGGAGAHQHQGEFTAHAAPGTGAAWFARRSTDAGTAAFITESGEGAHEHNVDIPPFTGNSLSQNARHTHPFNVPNFVGDTANTGVAAATHLPPYLTIFFIIKAK